MSSQNGESILKRIGIAIEMGQPFGHHHGCYHGILAYTREHRPDWQTVVDPYMIGLSSEAISMPYDGIVGRITGAAAEAAKQAGIPAVNHWMNSPATDLPGVFTDYRENGRLIARHLLKHGYRRIGLISWPTDRAQTYYRSGLQEVASDKYIDVQLLNVPYSFEDDPKLFEEFYIQLRQTLESVTPPIGIFVPMDSMAIYVVQLCDELGLRVPQDVGLVVAYNSLEICLTSKPTLSSVEADDFQVGYEAMALLDKLISGKVTAPVEPSFVPARSLRVRGSSEVFVSEDPVVGKAMQYIAKHARQTIGVEDVAEAAGVSKRTLSRRFSMHVGQSVLSEINRMRAEAIKQMLVDTEVPINEVADACGFASTSHFNVFFRKATGQTPGAYRREHRPTA